MCPKVTNYSYRQIYDLLLYSGIGGVLGFKAGFLFFLCLVDRKIRKEGRNCRRLQTAKSYLSIWVSTYVLSVFDSDKWIDNLL